jgi:hypothetical protein
VTAALFLASFLAASPAEAQWYVATFTGGNVTRAATVTVDQPNQGRLLDFHDLTFDARPLESPPYYGARLGHLWRSGQLGLEVEFLHAKAIGRTDRIVRVTGLEAGLPIDATLQMDTIVQRHSMTHGLNFLFANLVWRRPLGAVAGAFDRAALMFRAGAGPVVPGVDSVIDSISVQDYQLAGLGLHAAAGVDVRIRGRLRAMLEYKLTRARPSIDVFGGTTATTTLTHHVAVGFGFQVTREAP